MKPKKRGFGAGVGGIMVFTVISVLCVAVFAVLSMSSALADLRLSEKNAQMTQLYYELDTAGVRLLCRAEELWPEGDPTPDESVLLSELQAIMPDAEFSFTYIPGSESIRLSVSAPAGESRLFGIVASLMPQSNPETGSRWVIDSWTLGAADFEAVAVGMPVWVGE